MSTRLSAALAGLIMAATATGAAAADALSRGAAVYAENCAACHQEDARGLPGTAPSLVNKELLSIASKKYLQATIRDGRDGTMMPPFADMLTPAQIDDVVAYLRSFAKLPDRAAKLAREPAARGDAANGRHLYADICATCHGATGEGYEAGGSGTAIGRPGFLGKASDGFIRATIREGRSNTPMRGFSGPEGLANLSSREIDDVIAFLRAEFGASSVQN